MSKMSQLHADLTSQAAELGFQSIAEAEANGYTVVYKGSDAILMPTAPKIAIEEQTKAHLAWLVEKETIIHKLEMLIADTEYQVYKDTLQEAIDFIKRGEV